MLTAEQAGKLLDPLIRPLPARNRHRVTMTTLTRNSKGVHGKLLVITGGGSGIGRETALAFARCGAKVVLSDINVDAAKQTAAMIDEAGGTAYAYQVDVADEAAMRRTPKSPKSMHVPTS